MPRRPSSGSHGERRTPAVAGALEAVTMDDEFDPGSLSAESIGHYLCQQRKLRGISIEQLAEMTRIPVRSIERLETGHFDQDVDGFVRGFVRTVAEALGLDPDDALARMLSEPRGDAESGRPVSLLFARSLVGLFALALIVLAVGVVRVVLQDEAGAAAGVAVSPMVWRSDPVRALAESEAVSEQLPEAPPVPMAEPPPEADASNASAASASARPPISSEAPASRPATEPDSAVSPAPAPASSPPSAPAIE